METLENTVARVLHFEPFATTVNHARRGSSDNSMVQGRLRDSGRYVLSEGGTPLAVHCHTTNTWFAHVYSSVSWREEHRRDVLTPADFLVQRMEEVLAKGSTPMRFVKSYAALNYIADNGAPAFASARMRGE